VGEDAKTMKTEIKKSIFVLLDDMPSKENPHLWKHALDEVLKLSENCNITVVSPVWLPISLSSYKKNRERVRKLPPYKYEIGSVACWRPRYFDISLIPWKYRRHYIQIWSMIASLLFFIFRQRIRFDIVHAYFIYRPGYVASLLGKILRKPVIITSTGTDTHQNLSRENSLIRRRTISAMRWSSWIIPNSEFLRRYIAGEGFGNKTDVNPRGFSKDLFFPMDKIGCRNKLSLDPVKNILLFIGNLVPIKGADILIEAFKIVRDKEDNVELIIIGDGAEREVLEQQVCDGGLEEIVFFLSRKDHTQIPLYINASDILIVPSRNEGRSVAIIEALACGKPVVAFRVGGIPETIVNGKLGILVEKENPAALADGIMKALSSSWDIKYLSNHAKKYAQDRLTPRVSKVYDEVLSRA
jgi:glycosyltransferase involved in cell wall biosynthesis